MKIIDAVYVYKIFLGQKAIWHGRYHSHGPDEFEIHYFVEGKGVFFSNSRRFAIQDKTLMISAPNEYHSLLPEKITKPITYYAMLFSLDKENDKALFERLYELSVSAKKSKHIEETNLQFIFDEIIHSFNDGSDVMKKSASLMLEGLAYKLFMQNDEIVEKTPSLHDETYKKYVEKSIAIMEKRVYENVQIEELADELGISVEHFIRVFRSTMNITPLQYFYRLKIQSAAVMLLNTSLLIGDIAKKMSFENQFHFARVFKKYTGLSPSEYRIKHHE